MMDLITGFWRWFAMSAEDYIAKQNLLPADPEEYMFPAWNELLDAAQKEVLAGNLDSQSIENVLTVMALDNESENILDFIVDHATDEYVSALVHQGVSCRFHHARWQIAEILGRRKPGNRCRYLEMLSKDPDFYVSKRTGNVCAVLKEKNGRICNSLKDQSPNGREPG